MTKMGDFTDEEIRIEKELSEILGTYEHIDLDCWMIPNCTRCGGKGKFYPWGYGIIFWCDHCKIRTYEGE